MPGIPATMLAYLNAHPGRSTAAPPTSCARCRRAVPCRSSGQLPVGFVLDPCTVATVPLDSRGNGAFEREQNADQRLAYVDFIADREPRLHDEAPDHVRQHQLVQRLVLAVRREPVHQVDREQVHGHEASLRRQPAGLGAHQHARLVELSPDVGMDQELGRRLRLAPGHQLQRRLSLSEHDVLDAAHEPGLCDRRAEHQLPLVEVRQHGPRRDVRRRSLHEHERLDRRPLRHLRRARDRHAERSTRTRAFRRRRASSARSPGPAARARCSRLGDDGRGHGQRRLVERQHLAADRRPLAPVRHGGEVEPAALDAATTRCKCRSCEPDTSARPSSRKSASRRASSARSCNGATAGYEQSRTDVTRSRGSDRRRRRVEHRGARCRNRDPLGADPRLVLVAPTC